ncbi:uncharacterized protein M421DRAFT_99015 [Didymella exigua CBS 183.55]|uniref:D-mandelate dehydrogenase-like protein n=1 Tax=Didymella exigua CBS 183.55 TaxID=1150837 RepID=A0A6A5RTC4_9PLEO|nr:uncharacterized protein M421DRAFT_99015 [Didymella exigua CBS 183.55]KAF1931092.1 hypothetical protein M421DRAFT_99015 [Didymella exigua CBS 183.55]
MAATHHPPSSPADLQTPNTPAPANAAAQRKPTILHLGDDIRWNHDLYARLSQKFTIVRTHSLPRAAFKRGLQDRTWGDFVAMYRPFWNTGGEMGNWDDELIALLPASCKLFASAGAGYDWVDTRLLGTRGITYCNAASACSESVADAALFLILATYRLFGWSARAAHSCSPEQFSDAMRNIGAQTHNPNGTVLGIVGLGRIGARIATKARALEMDVWYHDVERWDERAAGVGARWCASLEELLCGSDCVVLAAPFSGRVLLGAAEFAWFKRGARLVNVARGALVDEDALLCALDEGRLAAVGMDVHATEPVVNRELAGRRNVMMLSHTAGASVESHVGFERMGMENLLGWLERGEEGLLSPVNLQWLNRDGK